jgi:organic hydroperoxide reductase OsmC/OhrA
MSHNGTIPYTDETSTMGDCDGDNRLDNELSPPGSESSGNNPEQPLAEGWSARFIGAMGIAAQELGVRFPADVWVTEKVDLINDSEEGFSLQARLQVSLRSPLPPVWPRKWRRNWTKYTWIGDVRYAGPYKWEDGNTPDLPH